MTGKLLQFAACLATLACGTSEPTIELLVTTDRYSYVLVDGEAEVQVTVENVGERGVALSGCPAPPFTVIEQWVDGSWHELGSLGIICRALDTHTIALHPGSRFEYTVSIWMQGKHRLRVLAGVDSEYPSAVALSNEFMVA